MQIRACSFIKQFQLEKIRRKALLIWQEIVISLKATIMHNVADIKHTHKKMGIFERVLAGRMHQAIREGRGGGIYSERYGHPHVATRSRGQHRPKRQGLALRV